MFAALSLTLLPVGSAAQSNTNTAPPASDGREDQNTDAPRIPLADAKKDFDAGTAMFIDSRGAESYKAEHVKGAVNITFADLPAKTANIAKGKKIIVYCS